MKFFFKIIVILLFSTSIISQNKSGNNEIDSNSSNNKYIVGDFAEGGVIFFVDKSGEHGLVIAKNDQSLGLRWNENRLPTKDGLLSSKNNTSKSIFNSKNRKDRRNSKTNAKRICAKLKIKEENKTYKKWYLPSKDELEIIYLNKTAINAASKAKGGSPLNSNSFYWSSTEYDEESAWAQNFLDGKQQFSFKGNSYNVRAIRAF